MSLVARHLEANGIPTVIVGSARDIVEEAGVARFLFVDFPLGNPIGKPYDVAQQRSITSAALDVLERSWAPRTTVQADVTWGDDAWRDRYMRIVEDNRAAPAAEGTAHRRGGTS